MDKLIKRTGIVLVLMVLVVGAFATNALAGSASQSAGGTYNGKSYTFTASNSIDYWHWSASSTSYYNDGSGFYISKMHIYALLTEDVYTPLVNSGADGTNTCSFSYTGGYTNRGMLHHYKLETDHQFYIGSSQTWSSPTLVSYYN